MSVQIKTRTDQLSLSNLTAGSMTAEPLFNNPQSHEGARWNAKITHIKCLGNTIMSETGRII